MKHVLIILFSIFIASCPHAETIRTTTTKTVIDSDGKKITTIEEVVQERSTANIEDELYHRRQVRTNRNFINPDIALAVGSAAAIGSIYYYHRHHHRRR